jgi:hypothetical protein
MKYFDTLPKIIQYDGKGSSLILTNIMARASVIPDILSNPLVFYEYDIQDGDTPEIVAHKYYGDSYRYWIVLYVNSQLDPQWDWPLSGQNFNAYIADKYSEVDPYSTVHGYQKIITQYDYGTNTTTVNKVEIDEDTYNGLVSSTNTYSLPTGNVTVSIEGKVVSVYEYEEELNESKRNIKLLNNLYVRQFESEFKNLMN